MTYKQAEYFTTNKHLCKVIIFFDALLTDIESLHFYAGIHLQEYGYYKMLSKRFPYAIYYEILDDVARVIAVLD